MILKNVLNVFCLLLLSKEVVTSFPVSNVKVISVFNVSVNGAFNIIYVENGQYLCIKCCFYGLVKNVVGKVFLYKKNNHKL